MSYSSSSNKSLQFNGYRFGEPVDMACTSPQSVSPRSSPQHMYNHSSKSQSSLNSPLSPLQSIISQQQQQQQQEQYVQPLTRDMLEKKDRLDLLLQNRPTPVVRMIQRRRSICNGYIYRRLYNEDNSPMTLATPFTKMNSGDSDASVNSPNSQYDRPYSGRHVRHHHRHSEKRHQHHRHPTSHVSSSVGFANRKDSNRDRSYGSITNKKQSTNSRSVNTSHASSNSSNRAQLPPNVSGPPRRFSGLVRLSAAHIALNRNRKNRKRQHYQSTMSILFHKLKTMASRVVNSRISEPADTKMSIEELTSLSRYLHVLKHGSSKDDSDDNEEDTHTSTDGTATPATTKQPPVIGLFVEQESDNASSNRDQDSAVPNEHDEETSPLLLSPSSPKRKRNLSSLGNIFPFAPLDRIPSLSRSASESSRINAESDCLLSPPSPQQFRTSMQGCRSRKKKYYLDKISRWVQHLCRPIRHFQQYHQHQQEHNTQIRFEGWSLFLFSPTSLTRLYLWKVVGARQVYIYNT